MKKWTLANEEFIEHLLEIYKSFEADMVQAEKDGKGKYADEDFEFQQFIRYLRLNH